MVQLLDDTDPAQRERGLRDSRAVSALCNGIIGAGGKWTPGMIYERMPHWGDGIVDLTPLGLEPPAGPFDESVLRLLQP